MLPTSAAPKTALRGLFALLILGLGQRAQAQQAVADSSLLAAARHRLQQEYARGLGYALELYNGPEYLSDLPRNTQGHPFFSSRQAQPATITYGGYSYAGVPLRYDLLRKQLVLTAPGGGRDLTLVNEEVTRFTLGGHSFVRLVVDSSSSAVRTGFYEVLVDGPVRLLAAHHKALQKRSTAEGVESEITTRDDYFLVQSQRYYPVAKAADVLRLFPQHKAALRQFASDNHLNFKPEGRALALVELVRYQATLAPASP